MRFLSTPPILEGTFMSYFWDISDPRSPQHTQIQLSAGRKDVILYAHLPFIYTLVARNGATRDAHRRKSDISI